MNKGQFIGKCVAWCVMAIVFIFAIGWITMILWNWLVPELFNGPIISYWQAMGLLLLSKILTWGFSKGYHYRRDNTPYWKKRFTDKFASLEPSEREAFKQKMKEKWCRWDQQSEGENPQPND